MEGKNSDLKAWLAKHPRMMGVLFVLILALSQVGNVAAAANGTTIGP